jgi:hypothetical protein
MDDVVRDFLCQDDNNSIVIMGPGCCGKTTKILDLISEDYNFLRPNYETLQKHEDFVLLIENFMELKTLDEKTEKKKILFFDDYDILATQNRFANSFIKDKIVKRKTSSCKFIFTCSNKFEKNIGDIKKCSLFYKIENTNSKSYYDKNIYDLVHDIFDQSHRDIKDIEIAISSEQLILSFIMYDNFVDYFKNNYKLNKQTLNKQISYIAETYALMTYVEDFSPHIDYFLFDISSLCKCYAIRCCQKQQEKSKKGKKTEISYTQITSRSAQSYNVKKKYGQELFYSFNEIEYISLYRKKNKIKTCNNKTNLNMLCASYTFNFIK